MRSPFADDRAALHEEKEGHARVPLASHGEGRAFVKDARHQEYFSCGCCRGYLGDEHRFRRGWPVVQSLCIGLIRPGSQG